MTFTDEESLLGHICKLMLESEIDFVVYGAASQWQAIGVDALVYRISQEENRTPSGVVVIAPSVRDGFTIDEDSFMSQCLASIEFCFLDVRATAKKKAGPSVAGLFDKAWNDLMATRNVEMAARGNGKRLLIAAFYMEYGRRFLGIFGNKHLVYRYRPVFSLLDEGVATYMTSNVWELTVKAIRRRSNQLEGHKGRWGTLVLRRLLTAVITAPRLLLTRYRDYVIEKHIDIENPLPFKKKQGRLIIDECVANSYRYVMEERGKLHAQHDRQKPLAMVLTQPFSEYEQVPLIAELDMLEGVIGVLCRAGLAVCMKAHPREIAGKYLPVLERFRSERITMAEHKTPAEELIAAFRPVCVIGYTSTALAVASIVFDIPAITIVDMLLGVTDDEFIAAHGAEFKMLTQQTICSVDTLEKLSNTVDSIMKSKADVG